MYDLKKNKFKIKECRLQERKAFSNNPSPALETSKRQKIIAKSLERIIFQKCLKIHFLKGVEGGGWEEKVDLEKQESGENSGFKKNLFRIYSNKILHKSYLSLPFPDPIGEVI